MSIASAATGRNPSRCARPTCNIRSDRSIPITRPAPEAAAPDAVTPGPRSDVEDPRALGEGRREG